MNYTISGSKFGFYGYLPAILKNKKNKVYLHKKYFKFFNLRKDLIKYSKYIIWYRSISEIQKKIDFYIIAKRPIDQVVLARKVLNFKNLKHLFLEKPVAPNFSESQKLLKFLKKNKVKFSIAYILIYTPFFKKLSKILKQKNLTKIDIYWSFLNKNKIDSWKLKKNDGGGVLNFYGIHFVHLFNILGFNKIINSTVKIEKKKEIEWVVNLKKNSILLNFNLRTDTNVNKFLINYVRNNKKYNLIKYQNPFIKKIVNFKKGISEDYRSKYLSMHLKITKENNFQKYVKTNVLLNEINKKTKKLNG